MPLEAVFPTFAHLAIAWVVLAVAEAVYILFGFGAGLIAVGTLALVLPDPKDVIVLLLLVGLPAELWVVVTSRRQIRWRGVSWICLGVVVGVPLGTWVLTAGNVTMVLTLLGLVLVVAGGSFLAVPETTVRWPPWTPPPVGLVSGVLSGMFGTGGPPLILYYQLSGVHKRVFRGELMAVFLVVTCIRLPSYLVAGLITVPRLWAGLAVAPAILAGAVIGHRIHLSIDEATFRRWVSVALMVIGGVLLVRLL